ncbi:DUF2249 domain-containing protein [Rhodocyclus tenuis]|uniref:DUF2249 domain-containing protein n=1 Tax=Rhodocyclus tenuis TaxID=1066 RepID=UPI0019034C9C|nr:hypothetical protein [Rhodocyclus tenuis]
MSAADEKPVVPTCADCFAEPAAPAAAELSCAEAFALAGGILPGVSVDPAAAYPGVDLVVDACGLEPPEPFVRAMEGLDALPPGGRLMLLLPRVPHPLYRVLAENGYAWQCTAAPRGVFEILIWQAA